MNIMKTFKHFILLTLLATILLGCNSEKKDWKATQDEGTIDAYIEYCENYPDSEHKAEIKDFLTEYIEDNKNEMYVLYDDFRLREEPNLDAETVEKMEANTRVEILEKSDFKEQIKISGHKIFTRWYKIKTENGKTGWAFGGGIGSSEGVAKAYKLISDQFPTAKPDTFSLCETTFWNLFSLNEKKDERTAFHENYFPKGIYAEISQDDILNELFDEIDYSKFQKFELPYYSRAVIAAGGPIYYVNENSPSFGGGWPELDSYNEMKKNEIDELISFTGQDDEIFKEDEIKYYYGSFIPLKDNFFAISFFKYTSNLGFPYIFTEKILIFNGTRYVYNRTIGESKYLFGFNMSILFMSEDENLYLQELTYGNEIYRTEPSAAFPHAPKEYLAQFSFTSEEFNYAGDKSIKMPIEDIYNFQKVINEVDKQYSRQPTENAKNIAIANEFLNKAAQKKKIASYMSDSWTLTFVGNNRVDGGLNGKTKKLSPEKVNQTIKIKIQTTGEGWMNEGEPPKPRSYFLDFNLQNRFRHGRLKFEKFEAITDNQLKYQINSSEAIELFFNSDNQISEIKFYEQDPG